VQYSEGVLVGYRWYATKGITPLFPFGYGLSYTSFADGGPTTGAGDQHDGSLIVTTDHIIVVSINYRRASGAHQAPSGHFPSLVTTFTPDLSDLSPRN
jgi:hypothetical protein